MKAKLEVVNPSNANASFFCKPYKPCPGLDVDLWPQASKDSSKWLRTSKKLPQLVLQGQ